MLVIVAAIAAAIQNNGNNNNNRKSKTSKNNPNRISIKQSDKKKNVNIVLFLSLFLEQKNSS